MENKESFSYTYSAAQQQEIENIRKKYLPSQESKMDQLRRLHSSTAEKARAWAIAIGVIGVLILGTGMSLCMSELGAAFGRMALVIGIAVGIAGMSLVALAYPVYNLVLKKERARIAPAILKLTEELLK